MAKKKVTKTKAVGDIPHERRGYLTYMEYFATGEGFTYEINFCYADTKQEAIEKHLDRFIGTDPNKQSARNYFGVGVVAYESDSKKAEEMINHLFKDGGAILHHLNTAGIEFHFKFYYNHS